MRDGAETNDGDRVLFDFARAADARGWRSIDDVVMGGVSASRFVLTGEGSTVFEGGVSLEQGGGFASVRSPDTLAESGGLAGFFGFELDLRGDGKTYKLNVRLGREFDGVVWQHAFTPRAGARERVRIAFDELQPTFRGRRVSAPAPFEAERGTSLGFVVGDRQAGAFRLELWRIGLFRGRP